MRRILVITFILVGLLGCKDEPRTKEGKADKIPERMRK
jgi:hypothetical protein